MQSTDNRKMLTPYSVGRSETGRVRATNEDSFFADDELGLYIVCDGMGGHDGGEVASTTAIKSVSSYFQQHRASLRKSLGGLKSLKRHVSAALREANDEICFLSDRSEIFKDMGTTITLLLIHGPSAVMGHCGDSRLYRVRNGLELLSSDHTFEQELRNCGYTGQDLDRYGHVLTRVLGRKDFATPDIATFPLTVGSRYLLCSGLSRYLDDRKQLFVQWRLESHQLVDQLIQFANHQGGADNITAVMVDMQ